MTSPLPEWICSVAFTKPSEEQTDKLVKALSIAWEALEQQAFAWDKATPDDFILIAKDAIRRIEELGR